MEVSPSGSSTELSAVYQKALSPMVSRLAGNVTWLRSPQEEKVEGVQVDLGEYGVGQDRAPVLHHGGGGLVAAGFDCQYPGHCLPR